MAFRTKPSQIAVLLAINLILCSLLVVSVEFLFGDWLVPYVSPDAAIVDRRLTYRQHLYEPAGDVVYVRDNYGLRGVHEPLRDIDLVTVGGSTTDQRYITEGETWQDVLRALTHIPLANAGVDGMTSYGHIVAVSEWLHKIPGLAPRYYLHYIGVNDASLSEDTARFDAPGQDSAWWRKVLRRSVIAKGALGLWLRMAGAREVSHGRITIATDAPDIPMMKVAGDRDAIDHFVKTRYIPNLRKLLDLHKQRNESVIFVKQPANPAIVKWEGGETFLATQFSALKRWALQLAEINVATEAVCKARPNDCRFIDLAGRVKFDRADFYDLAHTTPAGSAKIGRFLAGELAFMGRGPS